MRFNGKLEPSRGCDDSEKANRDLSRDRPDACEDANERGDPRTRSEAWCASIARLWCSRGEGTIDVARAAGKGGRFRLRDGGPGSSALFGLPKSNRSPGDLGRTHRDRLAFTLDVVADHEDVAEAHGAF